MFESGIPAPCLTLPHIRHLVAWLLAGACASIACSPSRPPATARHLVLVTIDTLRADRVGIYGASALTPRIDRIAHDGAYAVHGMAHVPLTRPSHATILSGLLPWELGVRDNLSPAELPSSPLLAEILKGAGFQTAAFVSSVVLDRRGGFARGFDRYDDSVPKTPQPDLLATLQRSGAETVAAAIRWLDEQRAADRLFLWVHLYEPHDPYEPPEPYASRYRDRPYDGEVAYADALVGELDDALQRLGLTPKTVLAIASDHGEGLGEHEETLHGFFVYETTLAVPIVMRGPGIAAGGRIDANVGLVDLLPTALDLVGVPLPRELRPAGTSLAAAFGGGPPPSAASPQYAESLVPLLHFGWSDLRVLRRGSMKYVLAPRPELYDLEADPHETRNLVEQQPSQAAAMRATLAKVLEQERRAQTTASNQTLPVDQLERLGALGYVSGGAATSTPGADPKDKIREFRLANEVMRAGILALNRHEYEVAARGFEKLVAAGIESFESHLYLARAFAGLNQPDRAAPHFERAARLAPMLEDAWIGWAETRRAVSGPEAALAIVREGRSKSPRAPKLAVLDADLSLQLRRPEEAIAALKAALPLMPGDPGVRERLGTVQRDLGQVDAAIASFRDAVAADGSNASAWNALGMTLGGNGRLDEAERAFRNAVERDATDHRYVFNLGLALARQGRSREARPCFERALQLSPGFAAARDELRKLPPDPGAQ